MKKTAFPTWRLMTAVFLMLLVVPLFLWGAEAQARTITAKVVALNQHFWYNRLGALNPGGMIYALQRDVVDINGVPLSLGGAATPGAVFLRPDKRPRPIVLRMNVGDILKIDFQNLLDPDPNSCVNPGPLPDQCDQPFTRTAGVHIIGLNLVNRASDGSFVGTNPNSLVAPGGTATYRYTADREGVHLLYSTAANTGTQGDGGSLGFGLFGAVNVEPEGAEWYRSQVTREELDLATRKRANGTLRTTPDGHPLINYNARYPNEEPYLSQGKAGLPILRMLERREIVHSDINAIITGPQRGYFAPGTYPENPSLAPLTDELQARTRNEPFREYTIIFHDEIFAIQAFPHFNTLEFAHTLHSVRDGFAINYGTGGIGSEILANRFRVGPMYDCTECKFEEFFLTSWAVGDPAMVVDIPANDGTVGLSTPAGPKATYALYPDDPSNVHHSYLGDRVKMRNLHAGPKEQHLFHLHAHQWLFTANDDNSAYLDSQAIGPGSGYTYEISYNGSGNRNQTVGDAIFHCHFYPHFAQGMWELWRVHDVFEQGTVLDDDPLLPLGHGKPAASARALPDAEILAGTPIPAVVPLPHRPLPPMPSEVHLDATGNIAFNDPPDPVTNPVNPGYPFYIPGLAGHRPPNPPLDVALDDTGEPIDGGLPRHVITTGQFPANPAVVTSVETPLDMTKELHAVEAVEIPEAGTAVEQAAMAFHAQRFHDTWSVDGTTQLIGNAGFRTNGLPPAPGAPYADPCVLDELPAGGLPIGNERTYKAAAIQLGIVHNKVGWHFPQSRILALWEDVADTFSGARPPEPLFFRANTNDCITYVHTNLVPHIYELDDFQVRTPTDILGQHIHLVKFDVTSSDGSGNGWNYEDGTFSPGEVIERINAINATFVDGATGGFQQTDGTHVMLTPQQHPFFNIPEGLGARATVQRWYADNVLNNLGEDRTLGTVFTHDHFGPSTHQQAGLYASLVVEPEGSTWKHNETGELMGTRADGGPTSWQAIIETPDPADSYREFLLQFQDFQPAYVAGAGGGEFGGGGPPVPDNAGAINPSNRKVVGLPRLLEKDPVCPNGDAPPCPEAIMAAHPETFTVNYRNEPIALRVLDVDPLTGNFIQTAGEAGDLAYAYRSDLNGIDSFFERAIPQLNTVLGDSPYPPLTSGLRAGDPFTPLMRAYDGDQVEMRIQVGATEETHQFTVHGLRWLEEANVPNSGYRNSQLLGISEKFRFSTALSRPENPGLAFTDHLYQPNASVDGQWHGAWGILRSYSQLQSSANQLQQLPSNPITVPAGTNIRTRVTNLNDFTLGNGACPNVAPLRSFDITAVAASEAMPINQAVGQRTLVYNSRDTLLPGLNLPGEAGEPPLVTDDIQGPLHDPSAIMYVHTADLRPNGRIFGNVPKEPLILRAAAGDCIEVTLRNALPQTLVDPDHWRMLPMIVEGFNANDIHPSTRVGLHPQLVSYDNVRHNGVDVGFNFLNTAIFPDERTLTTVAPGESMTYYWYAGIISENAQNQLVATPVEFGATNLMPADQIDHANKGAVGALIIEPQGSTWITDADNPNRGPGRRPSRAAATVTRADQSTYREFVIVMQDDISMFDANGTPVRNLAAGDDPHDTAEKAWNYRTEPLWFRQGVVPETPLGVTRTLDFTDVLANSKVGGDPQTPVFRAKKGEEVIFRVVHPGGRWRMPVFALHGHNWQREPYVNNSTAIGDNPLSWNTGVQEGMHPSDHRNMLLRHGAGGSRSVNADYLMRNQASFLFDGGQWGIFRVRNN
ncbi:MAG: hypothetical protein JSW39_18030 [Desulfobacterales bacterium]|nr:MAG: hypothetical protein JSW39_18030 [Desulfobacterales bacterium]